MRRRERLPNVIEDAPLQAALNARRAKAASWNAVARDLGISGTMMYILRSGRRPAPVSVLVALGLRLETQTLHRYLDHPEGQR